MSDLETSALLDRLITEVEKRVRVECRLQRYIDIEEDTKREKAQMNLVLERLRENKP